MGLRGPAPKPTDLRKLEGNPSRRPYPANEPAFPPGVPEKPKRLSTRGKKVWDELVDEMAGAAILRRVDQRALAQLSEDEALLDEAYSGVWQMVDALKAKAKAEGKSLPGGPLLALLSMTSGRLAMASVRDLAARVIIERREFGLTPSSRSRVETVEGGAGPMDALELKLCG
jgi:P27 family predicted phage terminase small subunit